MFAVLFEVLPHPNQWDAYLQYAKQLRPELEQVDGFIENIRYRSLGRDGWILSLSSWRDEKALVRWRTMAHHHEVQERGRGEVFRDYHLRVGQYTRDSHLPAGQAPAEQRLDETEAGDATTVILIDAKRALTLPESAPAADLSAWFGLAGDARGLVEWDVFDAVLNPGDLILMVSWSTREDAEAYERTAAVPEGARVRRVRVVRDYGKYDRREAPQYYPDVPGHPVRSEGRP